MMTMDLMTTLTVSVTNYNNDVSDIDYHDDVDVANADTGGGSVHRRTMTDADSDDDDDDDVDEDDEDDGGSCCCCSAAVGFAASENFFCTCGRMLFLCGCVVGSGVLAVAAAVLWLLWLRRYNILTPHVICPHALQAFVRYRIHLMGLYWPHSDCVRMARLAEHTCWMLHAVCAQRACRLQGCPRCSESLATLYSTTGACAFLLHLQKAHSQPRPGSHFGDSSRKVLG